MQAESAVGPMDAAPLSIWRQRQYVVVIGGQVVSQLGNSAFKVALAFSSLIVEPSGHLLPQVFLAQGIGLLLAGLAGGVAVDRMSARSLMLWCDLLRALVVISVMVAFVLGVASGWNLIALGIVFGLVDGVFQPAFSAASRELLPQELLGRANAIRTVAWRSVTLIGGPLGGALMLLNVQWAFGLNGVSFAVAAVLLLIAGQWPYRFSRETRKTRLWEEAREGLRFVWHSTWLRSLILLSCAAIAFIYSGYFALLPLIIAERSHGSLAYGLVLTGTSIGGIVGGVIMARVDRIPRPGIVFAGSLVVCAAAYFGIITIRLLPAMLTLAGIAGLATSVSNIAYATVLQNLVPREVLGRVSSIDLIGSYALGPLANAVLAAGVVVIQPDLLYSISLGIGCLFTLGALSSPALRRISLSA